MKSWLMGHLRARRPLASLRHADCVVAPSLGLQVNDWLIQIELAKLVLASSGVQSTAPTEVPAPHARARAQSIPARWSEAVVAADGERHRNG